MLLYHTPGSPERGRVPAIGPRRGGTALGPAQAEAQHELRQAVARAALLLRQEHHEQGMFNLTVKSPINVSNLCRPSGKKIQSD